MNELHLSIEALRDLTEIKTYIAGELLNPSAAAATVGRITKELRVLRRYPLSGASLSSVINMESDYRFLVSGNYISFYRVHGSDIYVDRILYARRDYLRVLFENTTRGEPE